MNNRRFLETILENLEDIDIDVLIEAVEEQFGGGPSATKGILYRLLTAPTELICPKRYKIKSRGVIEESQRHFPLLWRKDYESFIGDISKTKLKKRLVWSHLIIETYEGEKIEYKGLNNSDAKRLKMKLDRLIKYTKGITLRRK